MARGKAKEPVLSLVMKKVDVSDGCWQWLGQLSSQGYGRFETGSRGKGTRQIHYAHRFLWELLNGSVQDGLELDHLCRNRGCVNPEHLEPVTHQVNMSRGVFPQSMRTVCPSGHPLDAIGKDGKRYCKTCKRTKALAYYHRERAA